ncbi:MAG: alpha/beta hydrolase-fold protein [Phenylobacterium sp.]|uniref:alpha/beta hydrolase n=1 Tax=Brevundimonas sp. TaxID=1871086 RepID=UPI002737803A|nr:alpha/beta hydrolase-fold protein [Brevundimonas sp.]MDP3802207.1 alpha/beta hydrolase-fold protein [Brevundimonas sp.]MDZ4373595.1 alpha/beta hydrolase-fold protein [Phenylobacterium sp.]
MGGIFSPKARPPWESDLGIWLAIAFAIQGQALPELPLMALCGDEAVAVCRTPSSLTAVQAETRLAGSEEAFWVEGDLFHVVARRAVKPTLCCSIQSAMTPVAGSADLWSLSVRVRDLDYAMLDVLLLPSDGGGPEQWRGPLAPSAPLTSLPRTGELTRHVIKSAALGEERGLFVYRPAGEGPMPVIYLADGEATESFASLLRPMIEAGEIPPTMIVGLWSGPLLGDGEDAPPNRRHQEYLAGWNDGVYLAHEQFLLDEVMPLAERMGASRDPSHRMLAGFSDGAAWALNTAMVHPERFRGVIAMSFGGRPDPRARGSGYGAVYLTAGVLEPAFHDSTVDAATFLESAAEAVRLDIRLAGHSPMLWNDRFPDAVRWLAHRDESSAR